MSSVKVQPCKSFFLLISFLSLFLLSCTASPPEEKKYVVGIINPNLKVESIVDGFKEGMTGYGYVEGENTTYIKVSSFKEIDSALNDFKEKKVDLVFTITTPATKKAKKAMEGTNIPVVFGTAFDPVKGGIVKSLKHEGENITGIKVRGMMQKSLEWLLAGAPDIKRIFVPVKIDTKAAPLSLADLKEAAVKLNVELLIRKVETLEDLERELSSMPQDVDAVYIIHSIFVISNLDTILDTAMKRKLPMGAGAGQYKNGVTISYGPEFKRSGEKSSRLAHRILQGTPASSLPIETADYFLGINLKTAKDIGLEIPYEIADQADFIVR